MSEFKPNKLESLPNIPLPSPRLGPSTLAIKKAIALKRARECDAYIDKEIFASCDEFWATFKSNIQKNKKIEGLLDEYRHTHNLTKDGYTKSQYLLKKITTEIKIYLTEQLDGAKSPGAKFLQSVFKHKEFIDFKKSVIKSIRADLVHGGGIWSDAFSPFNPLNINNFNREIHWLMIEKHQKLYKQICKKSKIRVAAAKIGGAAVKTEQRGNKSGKSAGSAIKKARKRMKVTEELAEASETGLVKVGKKLLKGAKKLLKKAAKKVH